MSCVMLWRQAESWCHHEHAFYHLHRAHSFCAASRGHAHAPFTANWGWVSWPIAKSTWAAQLKLYMSPSWPAREGFPCWLQRTEVQLGWSCTCTFGGHLAMSSPTAKCSPDEIMHVFFLASPGIPWRLQGNREGGRWVHSHPVSPMHPWHETPPATSTVCHCLGTTLRLHQCWKFG